jgi:hypothetical protein
MAAHWRGQPRRRVLTSMSSSLMLVSDLVGLDLLLSPQANLDPITEYYGEDDLEDSFFEEEADYVGWDSI